MLHAHVNTSRNTTNFGCDQCMSIIVLKCKQENSLFFLRTRAAENVNCLNANDELS